MAANPVNEEAVFKVACCITDPEARSVYLQQICGDDHALFDRIAALLKVRDDEPDFLESPPSDLAGTLELSEIHARPGEQIGPYKLLQTIGEGGMGVVYMAEQVEPVKRRVALKVIKPGMDSRQVIARFRAERQALAMMDHPNIARIYDAGTIDTPSAHPQGRPYFVMELVRGVPITEYCDQHQLTTAERLELFTRVCHAVQHAHQKGVIHRDLKPSNVLVADYDDQPVPKIIDFGLAKAVSFTLTEMTNFTRLGQVVGTFEYMSPEQAKLNQLDVDTRTDIYALGVLAYELLTGSTPFDKERLRSAALDELLRIIRDEEPPKPSTRISGLRETAATISLSRKTDPQRLIKSVRGDLDWIVMKALEKDRSRRYETASELAADVQRYLRDEAVLAGPPDALYRLKRSVRRHRGLIAAAGLLILCLVLGIVGTSWGWTIAFRQSRVAEERLVHLREQQQAAAIVEALNLDAKGLKRSLEDARSTGSAEGWIRSMEAIPAMFSGDPDRALSLLDAALDKGENTLAMHGLRGLAYVCVGKPDKCMEEFGQIQDRLAADTPQSFQDKLFCAMFLTYFEPHGSFELADEAFRECRSPVALSVRATSRTVLACDTRDRQELEQAIAEGEAASLFLPDSPMVLEGCLASHLLGLYFARETNDQGYLASHREAGRQLVERLAEFPGFVSPSAAVFCEEIGDLEGAQRGYESLARANDSTFSMDGYIGFLFRHGQITTATQLVSGIGLEPYILTTHIIAAADDESLRHALRDQLVANLRQTSWSSAIHVRSLAQLCLLGYPERASAEAARIDSLKLEHEPLHRQVYRFFAGTSTADELYRLTEGRSRALCMVHLLVGSRLLGARDREGARAEFVRCKGMIGHTDYVMIRTILGRMGDPEWPRWLTSAAPL